MSYWSTEGDGRPRPPLYGIWEVHQMSIDEQPRLPLLTDSTRWRRAIFLAHRRGPRSTNFQPLSGGGFE